VSDEWVQRALASTPVGRLATVGEDGSVHLVPICFAVVGDRAVSAVDHKPKRSTDLQRLRDIRATGRAALLVDHYEDDWTRLWWNRIGGEAAVHEPGDAVDIAARRALVAKYRQYEATPPAGAVYSMRLERVTSWRAARGPGPDDREG
jgi:PPOX class probable F420-dependent enzyme